MNAMNKQNERPMKRRSGLGLVLGGLVGALVTPACASHVSVPAEIATCPCANGAFCCSSGVCAADATGCDVATAALSNSVAGEWQGYFENYSLSVENQSLAADDSLSISILVANDGTLSGHVTMGRATPPAPATDPAAVWPPGTDLDRVSFSSDYPAYIAGYAYQAHDIRWEARRLRFEIDRYEPWQSWCQLQLPSANPDGSLGCLPANANAAVGRLNDPQCVVFDTAGAVSPVSCAQEILCRMCTCDANGCGAASTPVYTFDVALRDGVGDGTSSLTSSPIRLNQASTP